MRQHANIQNIWDVSKARRSRDLQKYAPTPALDHAQPCLGGRDVVKLICRQPGLGMTGQNIS
jgi:hypothetical protein